MNVDLVLSTVSEAKAKEKVTKELQLHSDQGSPYTSHEYFKLTKEYHITQSMSRPANPYDNALAENFFSIPKTECIYRVKLKSFDEARFIINDYIYFYNNQRIQLKTKLTPLELRSRSFTCFFLFHRGFLLCLYNLELFTNQLIISGGINCYLIFEPQILITPQASFFPALPDGCDVKSSGLP